MNDELVTDCDEKTIDALQALVESAPSTTAVLNALSVIMYRYEDTDAGRMIAKFAEQFAQHEEKTL